MWSSDPGEEDAMELEAQVAAVGTLKVLQLHKLRIAFNQLARSCSDEKRRRMAATSVRSPIFDVGRRRHGFHTLSPLVQVGVRPRGMLATLRYGPKNAVGGESSGATEADDVSKTKAKRRRVHSSPTKAAVALDELDSARGVPAQESPFRSDAATSTWASRSKQSLEVRTPQIGIDGADRSWMDAVGVPFTQAPPHASGSGITKQDEVQDGVPSNDSSSTPGAGETYTSQGSSDCESVRSDGLHEQLESIIMDF